MSAPDAHQAADDPLLLVAAVGLGLLGGLISAWRASRLKPVEAMRRH